MSKKYKEFLSKLTDVELLNLHNYVIQNHCCDDCFIFLNNKKSLVSVFGSDSYDAIVSVMMGKYSLVDKYFKVGEDGNLYSFNNMLKNIHTKKIVKFLESDEGKEYLTQWSLN